MLLHTEEGALAHTFAPLRLPRERLSPDLCSTQMHLTLTGWELACVPLDLQTTEL